MLRPKSLLLLTGTLVAGCSLFDTAVGPIKDQVHTGIQLPAGAYAILDGYDGEIRYEQYFLVRPGGEWEFAEFGFRQGTRELYRLNRRIGVYKVDSGRITLQVTDTGRLSGTAGLTENQISEFPFRRVSMPGNSLSIREIDTVSFSALDLFLGVDGWNTYVLTRAPMALSAPTPLSRRFEPPLLTVSDTVRLAVGEEYILDMTVSARNPNTALFYLGLDLRSSPDSNATGRFTLRFSEAGEYFGLAYARAIDGITTSNQHSIVFVVVDKDRVPGSFLSI